MRLAMRSTSAKSRMSALKVSCCEYDFASSSAVSTGRSSSPRAAASSSRHCRPQIAASSLSSRANKSRTCVIPWATRCSSVLVPTPGSLPIGNGARNADSPPTGTTTNPRGLRSLLAIWATSLLLARPIETGICNSSQMRRWSPRAARSTSSVLLNPQGARSR